MALEDTHGDPLHDGDRAGVEPMGEQSAAHD